jgi:hypothetical protein
MNNKNQKYQQQNQHIQEESKIFQQNFLQLQDDNSKLQKEIEKLNLKIENFHQESQINTTKLTDYGYLLSDSKQLNELKDEMILSLNKLNNSVETQVQRKSNQIQENEHLKEEASNLEDRNINFENQSKQINKELNNFQEESEQFKFRYFSQIIEYQLKAYLNLSQALEEQKENILFQQ